MISCYKRSKFARHLPGNCCRNTPVFLNGGMGWSLIRFRMTKKFDVLQAELQRDCIAALDVENSASAKIIYQAKLQMWLTQGKKPPNCGFLSRNAL